MEAISDDRKDDNEAVFPCTPEKEKPTLTTDDQDGNKEGTTMASPTSAMMMFPSSPPRSPKPTPSAAAITHSPRSTWSASSPAAAATIPAPTGRNAAVGAGVSEISKQLRIAQAKNEALQIENARLERRLRILAELNGISVDDLKNALRRACDAEAFGDLRQKIAKLEAELEAVSLGKGHEMTKVLKEERKKLKEELQYQIDINGKNIGKIKRFESLIEENEIKGEYLKTQLLELTELSDQQKVQISALKESTQKYEEEIEALNENVKKRNDKEESYEDEIKALQRKLKEQETSYSDAENRIRELQGKLTIMEKKTREEIPALKEKLDETKSVGQKEINELQEKLALAERKAQDEIGELQQKLVSMEVKCTDSQNEIQLLNEKKLALEFDIDNDSKSRMEEIAVLQQKLVSEEINNTTAQQEILLLQEKLALSDSQAQEEINALKEKLAFMETICKEHENEMYSMYDKLKNQELLIKETNEKHSMEIQAMQSQVEFQTNINDDKDEGNVDDYAIMNLQSEQPLVTEEPSLIEIKYKEAQEEIGSLKRQLAAKEAENSTTENKQSENRLVTEESLLLESKYKEAEEEISALKSELAARDADAAEAQEKIGSLEEKVASMEDSWLVKRNKVLEAKLEFSEAAAVESEKLVLQLRVKLSNLVIQYNEAHRQIRALNWKLPVTDAERVDTIRTDETERIEQPVYNGELLMRNPNAVINMWKKRKASFSKYQRNYKIVFGKRNESYMLIKDTCKVERDINNKKQKYAFVIRVNQFDSRAPILYVAAEDTESYEQWLEVFSMLSPEKKVVLHNKAEYDAKTYASRADNKTKQGKRSVKRSDTDSEVKKPDSRSEDSVPKNENIKPIKPMKLVHRERDVDVAEVSKSRLQDNDDLYNVTERPMNNDTNKRDGMLYF